LFVFFRFLFVFSHFMLCSAGMLLNSCQLHSVCLVSVLFVCLFVWAVNSGALRRIEGWKRIVENEMIIVKNDYDHGYEQIRSIE